ncbi:MAG: sigma 54-interacting transcriptional regulator [Enterocloster bolteae]
MDKARLYASTNAGILINGNSGTGKELLAQSIHNASTQTQSAPSWLSTVVPSPPPSGKRIIRL